MHLAFIFIRLFKIAFSWTSDHETLTTQPIKKSKCLGRAKLKFSFVSDGSIIDAHVNQPTYLYIKYFYLLESRHWAVFGKKNCVFSFHPVFHKPLSLESFACWCNPGCFSQAGFFFSTWYWRAFPTMYISCPVRGEGLKWAAVVASLKIIKNLHGGEKSFFPWPAKRNFCINMRKVSVESITCLELVQQRTIPTEHNEVPGKLIKKL